MTCSGCKKGCILQSSKSVTLGLSVLLVALISIVLVRQMSERHNIDINFNTFNYLKKIREEKKRQTLKYFSDIEKSAVSIAHDEIIHGFFNKLRSNTTINRNSVASLDRHFIEKYSSFYDLLMVDSSGFVFHSIRQEADYRKNLLQGELKHTKLAKHLTESNTTNFSDFEYYYPSGESAAFFIVPVEERSEHSGWLILQCAINRVNTILTNREQFGRTVEVYLVNNDDLMISDSRFIEDQTILKLKIETESVKHARFEKIGEEVIYDYRGAKVYSSFEKFNYFNTSWVIIAEIDEAEVVTNYYQKHKRHLNEYILLELKNMTHTPIEVTRLSHEGGKVDVNEWFKALPGETLQTTGVSTCTAYAIEYPGRFGYLAHISTMDAVYGMSGITKMFLKDRSTNFVRELTNRVRYYDVTLSELPKLEFLIVAVHPNSFSRMVDQLLAQGIELDQIRFAYNPLAQSASVHMDIHSDRTSIIWHLRGRHFIESAHDYETLGSIVKKHVSA